MTQQIAQSIPALSRAAQAGLDFLRRWIGARMRSDLADLRDRDLAVLGIARGDIPRVARAAARKVRGFAGPEPAMATDRHESAAGHRDYRIFRPRTRPRGLVMMLHGCAQSAEDFARGTAMNEIAARRGWVVVWPEQSSADNPKKCWNWFRSEHQSRGFGEPAILAGIAEDLILRHRIPRHRVAVAGFSAGAAMAMVLRDTYPDVFRTFAAHSGVGTGLARNGVAALSAMRHGREVGARSRSPFRPTLIVHGTSDDVVSPTNAAQLSRRLPGSTLRMVPGLGHAWSGGDPGGSFTAPDFPEISREIAEFFARSMRRRRWFTALRGYARAA